MQLFFVLFATKTYEIYFLILEQAVYIYIDSSRAVVV